MATAPIRRPLSHGDWTSDASVLSSASHHPQAPHATAAGPREVSQPLLVFNTDHPSVKLLHPVSSVPLLNMPLLFPAKILIIQLNRKCTLGILLYVEQKIMRFFFFFFFNEGKKKMYIESVQELDS